MFLNPARVPLMVGALLLVTGCSLEPPRPAASQGPRQANLSPQPIPTSGHPAVAIAEEMLGRPYRYGGNTPQGFDCSGLVYYSYSKAGYRVPRDSGGQYAATSPIDPRELRPGDLLFFNIDGSSDHVAIYVGNNRFIHAPSGGKRVSYASLGEKYWRNRFLRAGRVR